MGLDKKYTMIRESMAKKSSYWSFSLSTSSIRESPQGTMFLWDPIIALHSLSAGKNSPFLSLPFLYFLFLSRNNFQCYSQSTPSAVSVLQINLSVYKTVRTSFVQHVHGPHAMMTTKQLAFSTVCLL